MSFTEKNIYELLPAYYRSKDIEHGSPLQALINIIAGKAIDIENNIAQLYDNWFIETSEEWVIPYIGELLGVQNINAITGSSALSQRAYVANTLSYRRRKGIAPILEQLALDIAGWRAHVVEFFQLLATTQYMNHIRLDHPATPDLRSMNQLDLLNGAFDSIAHSVDVRHISSGRGKYNISNIGLFIWRLQSYKVARANAMMLPYPLSPPSLASSYFTFSPLGYDMHLFNNPQTETNITHVSEEINVPALIRRRALFEELETRRQSIVDGIPVNYTYFDNRMEIDGDSTTRRHPVFEIFPNDSNEPVPPEEIAICNLERCCTPSTQRAYEQSATIITGVGASPPESPPVTRTMPITVAVDPETGRFIFTDPSVTKARVSYSYGFSGDIGSGPYNRWGTIPGIFKLNENDTKTDSGIMQNAIWQVGVSKTIKPVSGEKIFTTITEALDEWATDNPSAGIISIMDNGTYAENLEIIIKEKSHLFIIAADWPKKSLPNAIPGEITRMNGDIVADSLLPLLHGSITIHSVSGSAVDFETKPAGQLTLNGVLVKGRLTVSAGNLGALNLTGCTLVPGDGGIEIGADAPDTRSNQWLQVNMQKSICGPITLHDTAIESLIIDECIIDNSSGWAILANKAPLQANRSTILGKVNAKTISADNCIFNDVIKIERRQTGCIRFSFVPFLDYQTPPETPRRFRCQPELEINTQISAAKKSGTLSIPKENSIKESVFESLVPSFTSTKYGQYAYAQLNINCPVQVNSGADDGAEMGVFNFLKQPQRKANLLIALDEYVRIGLETGLIYVT